LIFSENNPENLVMLLSLLTMSIHRAWLQAIAAYAEPSGIFRRCTILPVLQVSPLLSCWYDIYDISVYEK